MDTPQQTAPTGAARGSAATSATAATAATAAGSAAFAEAEEFLRLDNQICFALHAASRAFNGVYRVALKDLRLTYPQYLVMLVLWEHGELPVKTIGAHLRLDSGTLSPLLKRLEASGYVERRRSARDERSVTARTTPAGAALRDKALDMPRRMTGATGLPLAEIQALRARLDTLTAGLDEAALRAAAGDCATEGD